MMTDEMVNTDYEMDEAPGWWVSQEARRNGTGFTIQCGKCERRHHSAATVRLCYAGELAPCDWNVADHGEDGPMEVPCMAPMWADGRGKYCEAGHEHVFTEARYAEGWDYADGRDAADYKAITSAGRTPMNMDGSAYNGPTA